MRLKIQGGTVVDGTGNAPFPADILIERDTILAVGDLTDMPAREVIDARGRLVTPGLIDCHTHSDLLLPYHRQAPHAVYSGISTLVVGQCGLGFAPIPADQYDASVRMHAGIFGNVRGKLPRWASFAEYLRLLDGAAVNAMALAPHNAIRQFGCGFDNRPLTGAALEKACAALDEALTQGAAGLSIGLSYYPGSYADTQELVQLCRVVAKHDALFCTHVRLNIIGPEFDPLQEMAEVVGRTGVRLHVLHHRTMPPATIGHPEALFAPFEASMARGAHISFEYYPYLAGAGYLLVHLPGWVQEGGPDAILDRLASPALRDRLLRDIEARYPLILRPGVQGVVSATRDPYADEQGLTFEEIAAMRGITIAEAIVQLLIENELAVGFHETEPADEATRAQLWDDQYAMFSHPRYTIGSDTIPLGPFCHPRAFGTYPRVIRQMLDRGMPIEKIIHKLTQFPAEIYRIKDRGTLSPGMRADVCLWDQPSIRDRATYAHPRVRGEGLDTLIVNGIPVLTGGGITGLLPGQGLSHQ